MKYATTNQAKVEKAQLISQAALSLFETHSFDEIKMAEIAKLAKVSKGTLFNYYPNKESIFMELLLVGYQKYFTKVRKRVISEDVRNLAELRGLLLDETKQLILEQSVVRLNALRGPLLEKDSIKTQTLNGRKQLYDEATALNQEIAQRIDGLTESDVNDLFITQTAIIGGLINLSGLDQFNHETVTTDFNKFHVNITEKAVEVYNYYLSGKLG